MVEYYKSVVFENYANFSGRARRSEYWYFVLAHALIISILGIVCAISFSISESLGYILIGLLVVYVLAIIVPSLAVIVRRLHDIGKSGVYFFVRFIPFVGGIWLLILLFTEGNNGRNMYGEDPKEIFDEIDEIGEETGY
ncbi:DUF805 domain-containing protein [Flavobacterium sp.]|uniref:DUF805 domain-containing protein n=1 Tax=Flavobacterium sp. TaxID=239 RepID=UPI00286B8DB9|nr:DUF805 domain-containing protein [Flavobacterium sp.]